MPRRTEDDLSLRAALGRLPRRAPPTDMWSRIEAGLAEHEATAGAAQDNAAVRTRTSVSYALAAGVAAILCVAALLLIRSGAPDVPPAPVRAVDDSADFADLLAESARLERALVAFPRHEGVIRVSTAGTIAGLEDQIAWIDAELSASAAFGVDPAYQKVLWRERVEVMNALVDVHYAQLPARVLRP